MSQIIRPNISAVQLAKRELAAAQERLMMNPPEAENEEELKRKIELFANGQMVKSLELVIKSAKRRVKLLKKVQTEAVKDEVLADEEQKRLAVSAKAYPSDEQVQKNYAKSRQKVREARRKFGLSGQAIHEWNLHARKLGEIIENGIPVKGESLAGVIVGQGR